MAETGEQPIMEEQKQESPVVAKTKGAVEKMWEGMKGQYQEYADIRKSMDKRLAWHGGGVYEYRVKAMDTVSNAFWDRKDAGPIRKGILLASKIKTRLDAVGVAFGSATADALFYNPATWLFRKFLPIPKDYFKRLAIGQAGSEALATGVVGGTVGIAGEAVKGVVKGEMALNKGVKKVGTEALAAVEAVPRFVAKKVEQVMEAIKHPKVDMKKA